MPSSTRRKTGISPCGLAQSGANVLFAVTDDGIGIPEEDQKHIFERFYRVDKARSRATGGTGLGLSIVRQLAAMHGGTVSVSSQPEPGRDVHRYPADGCKAR